jgi:uncharacterized membrane protein YhaH (DUF805 family)
VHFDVLTEVPMKNIDFWVVALCNLVEVYRCLRGTYCLHCERQGESQACKQMASRIFAVYLFPWLALWSWRWRQPAYSTLVNLYQTITWPHNSRILCSSLSIYEYIRRTYLFANNFLLCESYLIKIYLMMLHQNLWKAGNEKCSLNS